jgi:hypothetical protein
MLLASKVSQPEMLGWPNMITVPCGNSWEYEFPIPRNRIPKTNSVMADSAVFFMV